MNFALWAVQILLVLGVALLGLPKILAPVNRLHVRIPWTKEVATPIVRTIGALEALGVAGLILPGLTHILPWLTVAAAAGLALTMIGAAIFHMSRNEGNRMAPAIVFFLMALFIIVGRLAWAPLA